MLTALLETIDAFSRAKVAFPDDVLPEISDPLWQQRFVAAHPFAQRPADMDSTLRYVSPVDVGVYKGKVLLIDMLQLYRNLCLVRESIATRTERQTVLPHEKWVDAFGLSSIEAETLPSGVVFYQISLRLQSYAASGVRIEADLGRSALFARDLCDTFFPFGVPLIELAAWVGGVAVMAVDKSAVPDVVLAWIPPCIAERVREHRDFFDHAVNALVRELGW